MSSTQTRKRFARFIVGCLCVLGLVYLSGRMLTSGLPSAVGIDYHAGGIESRSNSTVSSSHSSSDHTSFSPRRIAILVMDPHPAMRIAAGKVRETLAELPYVDSVEVFDPGQVPAFGEPLYDAYLTLSIDVQHDTKPFVQRDFKAKVRFVAGSMPYKSHSSYLDHLTPPPLDYILNGTIEHESKSTQVGTPYKLVGDEIGKQIAGSVVDQFDKWRAKFGFDGPWPSELMGAYPADLSIPWPTGVSMDRLVDGYGLMLDRRAMWTTLTDDPKPLFEAFRQACLDAGWQIESQNLDADEAQDVAQGRYHLRARKGYPLDVEVFEVREGWGERKPGEVSRVCVQYRKRFDQARVQQVVEKLLEEQDPSSMAVLGRLTRQMNGSQRDRYDAMLAASNPSDPGLLLRVARYMHRQDDLEQAGRYLQQAYLQAPLADDPGQVKEQVKRAAKELNLPDPADQPMTQASLEAMGYRPIEGLVGQPMTLKVGQPLRVYYTSDDRLSALDLWVMLSPENNGQWDLHHHERYANGGSAWGRTGLNVSNGRFEGWHTVTGDGQVYEITLIEREPGGEVLEVQVVSGSG